jgi:membrane protease YdiL (CAAX protease family)
MIDDAHTIQRGDLLKMAFWSEGAILAAAFAAGWFLDHLPTQILKLTFAGIGMGVIATIPLLVLLALVYQSRLGTLVQFRELVQKLLGKPLAACGWIDLCLIALSAGVAEEFLFRGVLEPCLSHWGALFGLITCNLLFGLCHAVNLTYFVYSALVGAYLSLTLKLCGEPNLLVPVSCHALYDLVAFGIIRRLHRESETQ